MYPTLPHAAHTTAQLSTNRNPLIPLGPPLPLLHHTHFLPPRPRTYHLLPTPYQRPRRKVHTDAPVLVLKPSVTVTIRGAPLSPSEKESRRCRTALPGGRHRLLYGLPPQVPTKPPPAASTISTRRLAPTRWHAQWTNQVPPTTSATAWFPSARTTRPRNKGCEPSGVVGPHIVIRLSRIFRSRLRVRPRLTVFSLWATHQIRKSRGQAWSICAVGFQVLAARRFLPSLRPHVPAFCTGSYPPLSPRPLGRGARGCPHKRATVRSKSSRSLDGANFLLRWSCLP